MNQKPTTWSWGSWEVGLWLVPLSSHAVLQALPLLCPPQPFSATRGNTAGMKMSPLSLSSCLNFPAAVESCAGNSVFIPRGRMMSMQVVPGGALETMFSWRLVPPASLSP